MRSWTEKSSCYKTLLKPEDILKKTSYTQIVCQDYNTYMENSMELTQEEWNELVALKEAINYNPASVHPDKMELFTELLVRSWSGKTEVMTFDK